MTARYIVGDVHEVLASLEPGSVDLVVSSPPFLALRSYLPADHPDKAKELGSEATPGEFLDTMLDVVEACGRVLTPHGSLVFELGDTYAGSGGAGGDYNEGGLREDAPKFTGSALSYRKSAQRNREGGGKFPENSRRGKITDHDSGRRTPGPGWPLEKSKVLIPQLFAIALAYGFNPLTGRTTEPWRVRNTVAWCRPNPPVGRDGDKFRPATSFLTVATKARDRYWDGDAVRSPGNSFDRPQGRGTNGGKKMDPERDQVASAWHGKKQDLPLVHHPAGAPLLDWWEIPTAPYKGSHYATYPPDLVVPVVKSMCPQRVCTTCGEPSRRIVRAERVAPADDSTRDKPRPTNNGRGVDHPPEVGWEFERETLGWSDCGHDSWRPGVALDPFAGSGTTLAVATGHGRDAIGVDLDERNAELARERVGMFLTVEYPERAA